VMSHKNDLEFYEFRGERLWVAIEGPHARASVMIKQSPEGVSIHVNCACGECVTETWATWDELIHDEDYLWG